MGVVVVAASGFWQLAGSTAACAVMSWCATPVVSEHAVRIQVARAAKQHGVDPKLADAVASVESRYRNAARSPKGAVGVMQLMPATARDLGVNPWNYRDNIDGGVWYLRLLLDRYDGDVKKALAAYNAGPGVVDEVGGIPPYRETQDYVAAVLRQYHRAGGAISVSGARRMSGCGTVRLAVDSSGRLYLWSPALSAGCEAR